MADQVNPFAVQTPEDLTAEVVVSLFVNVFSDFSMVEKPGHTFLHGPRGSGKSMMFRYLEPDCQAARRDAVPMPEREFFGVLLPIKKTDLNVMELARLEDKHANIVLNEHLLTVAVAARTFAAIRKARITDEGSYALALAGFYKDTFRKLVAQSGWDEEIPPISDGATLDTVLGEMQGVCDSMYLKASNYLRRLSFTATPLPYTGPLTGYLDFMVPLVQGLRKLPFMARGPVYLLIDDADNLNQTQTRILNTWVSYRTIGDISLKISTQLRYKSFGTAFGGTIDAPHDYSEVYISSVYTSSRGKNKYLERIREIVRLRLDAAKIDVVPEQFFPPDEVQEQKIRDIGENLRRKWEAGEGRGYRPSDDVTRYARPEFIKSLRGKSKSGSTYSYAGFDQLVHISDGVIRHFLEAASRMWSVTQASNGGADVTSIPPSIQNQIVREMADSLMSDFDKLELEDAKDSVQKLRNLVEALGGIFQQIMLSDRSERRAFSIAFSDAPDEEVQRILDLGVRYGYLQRSYIGNKDGTGRTVQYIFSRRLAPRFTLDPTSFAGYQFVRNEAIRKALHSPTSLVRSIKGVGADAVLEARQGNLFEID